MRSRICVSNDGGDAFCYSVLGCGAFIWRVGLYDETAATCRVLARCFRACAGPFNYCRVRATRARGSVAAVVMLGHARLYADDGTSTSHGVKFGRCSCAYRLVRGVSRRIVFVMRSFCRIRSRSTAAHDQARGLSHGSAVAVALLWVSLLCRRLTTLAKIDATTRTSLLSTALLLTLCFCGAVISGVGERADTSFPPYFCENDRAVLSSSVRTCLRSVRPQVGESI